jgi:flavodoxin
MNAVIVYATNSGSTYQAATLIADGLEKNGYTCRVVRAADAQPTEFSDADLCLLGSNSWEWIKGKERLEGQLNDEMRLFLDRIDRRSLAGHSFALFACGDSSYTIFCGGADHLESFVKDVNGKLVTPTLRIDKFYYDLEKNRQLVSEWAGHIR